jgi:putative hydrolase of the HAD superfamily
MRLALFDLDNTLVDRTRVFALAAAALADEVGIGTEVFVSTMVAAEDGSRRTWPEFFTVVRDELRLTHSVDELMARHRRNFLANYRADAATLTALAALRSAGWRVGIVTNGSAFQSDKLRVTGLDQLVDACVVSEVLGSAKPAPAIFAAAASACGCAGGDRWAAGLEAGWMVGDSATADIAGAAACGLRTMWMRCGRRWEDAVAGHDVGGLLPDHVVDDVPAAVALMLA